MYVSEFTCTLTCATYIHTELGVSKGVGASLHGHERGTKSLGDIGTGVQHILDDDLELFVLAFLLENIVEGGVGVLLLGGGVEGSGGGTVLVFAKELRRRAAAARECCLGSKGRHRRISDQTCARDMPNNPELGPCTRP